MDDSLELPKDRNWVSVTLCALGLSWRCQGDTFSHCVVKVNYAPLERRKVYFV